MTIFFRSNCEKNKLFLCICIKLKKNEGENMSKYMFFDIDGTLLGPSRKITPRNRWAIEQVRKQGHKVFICTGRAPVNVFKEQIDVPYDGVICSAGGYIIIDGQFVYENFMNQYILSEVMTMFFNNKILFKLEAKECIYVTPGIKEFFSAHNADIFENNLELIRFHEKREAVEYNKPIKDFDISKTGIAKLCFIAPKKESFERCESFLKDFFHVVTFSPKDAPFVNGEIILKHCTKAHGIEQVMNYYGVSMDETIAFGDSMNDYQMLEAVNTGVVYKDSSEELKALGQYYFDGPDDDGIYKVLKEMGYVGECDF